NPPAARVAARARLAERGVEGEHDAEAGGDRIVIEAEKRPEGAPGGGLPRGPGVFCCESHAPGAGNSAPGTGRPGLRSVLDGEEGSLRVPDRRTEDRIDLGADLKEAEVRLEAEADREGHGVRGEVLRVPEHPRDVEGLEVGDVDERRAELAAEDDPEPIG